VGNEYSASDGRDGNDSVWSDVSRTVVSVRGARAGRERGRESGRPRAASDEALDVSDSCETECWAGLWVWARGYP